MIEFSPAQVALILTNFGIALVLAIVWYIKDRRSKSAETHGESFSVLMSVFFWGVVFAFALKMLIDMVAYYAINAFATQWFFIATLFLEEVVKIGALFMGIGLAGRRFNELSDGVMYTLFAALGFIFFENIIYVAPYASDFGIIGRALFSGDFSAVAQSEAARLLFGRNIFTFAMHLFTVIFGIFFAFAYLHSHKLAKGQHRVKPWQIGMHARILWNEFGAWLPLWIPFAPFVSLWQFMRGGMRALTIPEILWSGFLFSSYLHIGYDLILETNFLLLHSLTFIGVVLFLVGLFGYFSRLDIEVKNK